MSNAIDHVGKITGRWARFVNDSIDRWKLALADARNGTYTSDRFARDTITYAADAVDAWKFPIDILVTPVHPVIVFEIAPADLGASKSVQVEKRAAGILQSADLALSGSATKKIPMGNVDASVFTDGTTVLVKLINLQAIPLPAGPLIAGTYTGDIGLPNDKAASIEVRVK